MKYFVNLRVRGGHRTVPVGQVNAPSEYAASKKLGLNASTMPKKETRYYIPGRQVQVSFETALPEVTDLEELKAAACRFGWKM